MTDNSENNKRIAKNTFFLYGRMLFSMLVSLYTSRVVLATLGEVDYGLYNVVGGFVVMFSMVSGSLSGSVSRFLTFEIGKGDNTKLQNVFSTSMMIHIFLALIMLLGFETLGLWFLNTQLTIPPERMLAANWVFQCSVISFVIGIIGVPYNAIVVAYEKMNFYAILGVVQVLLLLFAVLFLAYTPYSFDKLIGYGIFNVLISVILQVYTWLYCRKNFSAARVTNKFDKSLFKEIGSFAGWNFIGSTAGLLKDHGVNILLNIFGGPVINAARGIAGTINGAVTKFSGSFMTALNPQIIKSYASNNREYLFSIVERGSRFSYYAMFIFALPVFLEIELLLSLWLKDFPAHTANFARLFLIHTMIDILSSTLITLQSATGKIRDYQIVVGGVLLLNFPFSYIALKIGFSPESTLVVAIVIAVICLLLRLLFLRKMAGLSVKGFMYRVTLNVFMVTLLSSIIPFLLFNALQSTNIYSRFVIVILSSLICSSLVILFVGCSKNERNFIISKTREVLHKIKK